MVSKTLLFPWLERFLPWICRKRYSRFMGRILSCKSLISIDRGDFNSLFENSKYIFSREYSISAYAPDRMNLLVSEAKSDIQNLSSGHCKNLLFYIFSPKCNEVMMDEMYEIHEWLADNEDTQIQWGYGVVDDDKVKMIVIWD